MGAPAVGSVVVVAFPYADFTRFKNRPALVVGQAEFHNLILCQITSQSMTSQRAVPISDNDFSEGGLKINSFARPDKLFTIEASVIQKKIGTLQPAKQRQVLREVQDLFRLETGG